jgi:hypothetical protein
MDESRQSEQPDSAPTHEELKRQLRRLMTKGLAAARPEDVAPLLALHAVRTSALVDLPSARLAALRERIYELTRGTRNERLRQLAPFAFGTYSSEPWPLDVRLRHAEVRVGRGYEALRKKYLDQLAGEFADRLLLLEERLRHNDWLNRPSDEALHDEILRQYDFYTAMGFWLNAAARDLEAALEDERDGNRESFHGYASSALWRWTKFLRYAHRYDVEFLGEWTTTVDLDIDEVVRAHYDAEAVPPFSPYDRSWLRVELLSALHEELAPFIEVLEQQTLGRRILERWHGWLRSCKCELGDHVEDCSVGRFLREAKTFFDLMNQEISQPHRIDRAARFQTLPDVFEP